MDLIYLLIIFSAFFSELSCKVNTESITKKIALGLMIVGCLLSMADKQNHLIYFGVLGYFAINIATSYFHREKRRISDKVNG
jgi:asparagine N-glycosylation enzyme membrane subunit Stt3